LVTYSIIKGQCHEIFSSDLFHESVSLQPQSIALGPFQIFSNIPGDIRKSRCTFGNWRYSQVKVHLRKLPPVLMTLAANLPSVSMTPAANFATSFASVVDTGGKFAAGVVETSGKFPQVSLPLVSMTPVENNGNNIRLLRP
jgi:hypothetical protein